jgi:hypothetical protein
MCSDPEDENGSCEGGIRLSGGGSLGNPKRMSVYQKREISAPPIDLLGAVFSLAGGDMALVGAWAQLYQTQSGYQYAMYIVNNKIQMMWGAYSETKCEASCIIYLGVEMKPAYPEFDPNPDKIIETNKANQLVDTLGHEGYHAIVTGVTSESSQWEEAMAFYVGDEIYFELTGVNGPSYTSLQVINEASLQDWINIYHSFYSTLSSYPGYR